MSELLTAAMVLAFWAFVIHKITGPIDRKGRGSD